MPARYLSGTSPRSHDFPAHVMVNGASASRALVLDTERCVSGVLEQENPEGPQSLPATPENLDRR